MFGICLSVEPPAVLLLQLQAVAKVDWPWAEVLKQHMCLKVSIIKVALLLSCAQLRKVETAQVGALWADWGSEQGQGQG